MTKTYLPEVRNQYENLPYPERNPEDERTRLVQTIEDKLDLINHYCFNGKQKYGANFRCLVAGGGTGDAVIHLAEQLKGTKAEVVYLDMSTASMEVAQSRAKMRKLKNITWINDSLLNLPNMDIGKFDYINCSGVLHHLEDRTAGLQSLCSVLKNKGAMAIMVYGRHARASVYQMQELMKHINSDIGDMQLKIDNAKRVMTSLPATNMFNQLDAMLNSNTQNTSISIRDDAEIYDLFMHSQDVPFSIPELYEWLDTCNLNLVTYPSPLGGKYNFLPASWTSNPELIDTIEQLPIRKQQAIAELVRGNMITHTVFVSRNNKSIAVLDDLNNIPFLFVGQFDLAALAAHMSQHPDTPIRINHPIRTLILNPGKYLATILKYLDGKRSIGEIFDSVRKDPTFSKAAPDNSVLMQEFRTAYEMFNSVDVILLRDKTCKSVG